MKARTFDADAKKLDVNMLYIMVVYLIAQCDDFPFLLRFPTDISLDNFLKVLVQRVFQVSRTKHPNEAVLNWIEPDNPQLVFVAAMAFDNPRHNEQYRETAGLCAVLSENWENDALNKVFTWMSGHDKNAWRRCYSGMKRMEDRLEKEPFSLFDNLSQDMQQRLQLCQSLGIAPSAQFLGVSVSTGDGIDGIGLFV